MSVNETKEKLIKKAKELEKKLFDCDFNIVENGELNVKKTLKEFYKIKNELLFIDNLIKESTI